MRRFFQWFKRSRWYWGKGETWVHNEDYRKGQLAGRERGSFALSANCKYSYGAGVVHGALERLEKGKQL